MITVDTFPMKYFKEVARQKIGLWFHHPPWLPAPFLPSDCNPTTSSAENEEIEQAIATASPLARYIWADINPNAIMTYAYKTCSKTMLQRLWVLDSNVIDTMVDHDDFRLSDLTAAERALMMALSNSQHDIVKALASQS